MAFIFKIFKWTFKTILVLLGVFPLSKCSPGYREQNGKITFNGKEINDKNFIVLNDHFAKDDTAIYFKDYIIENADIPTFEALDAHYAKDKWMVYYCKVERDAQAYYLTKRNVIFRMKDADVTTFKLMNGGLDGYAVDKKQAYFNGVAFVVKDVQTLQQIDGRFVKDQYHVYFDQSPIKMANPVSFEILNSYYAKDDKRFFYYGKPYEFYNGIHEIPCDVASFELLEYPYSKDQASVFYYYTKILKADSKSFQTLGSHYSKDKNYVFLESEIMNGADPASFSLVPQDEYATEANYYSRDKNKVFWKIRSIEKANPDKFKVIGLDYSTDGQHIFYESNLLPNVDVLSFEIGQHNYGESDAKDKNHQYLKGKRL